MLGTKNEILTLSAESNQNPHWNINASFAVHPDIVSHTREIFIIGFVSTWKISTNKKAN